jgi:hypothetical protein
MLLVQALALVGLVWYTFETYRLRKSSERQVEISQDLINAAMAQVEGLSKPCLILLPDLRDGADTILEMHGAVGSTRVGRDQGRFVVRNIGNGVALNVSYRMERLEGALPVETRYIHTVPATEKVTMIETLNHYDREVLVVFEYESIGKRRYRSTIDMNHHVLTKFRFMELDPTTTSATSITS